MAVTVAKLQEAVVSHRGKKLLGPLSFVIKQGEFWGIIGPNGAGKSTLLRTLAGKQVVSGGQISLFEYCETHGLTKKSPPSVLRRTGILLQRHDFLPDIPFTVEDVVLFGRIGYPGIGRQYRPEDRVAVDRVLGQMEMLAYRYRLYRELSGGEQRKVQLARLLAQEPELMLLDEPTTGLDMDWQERLTSLIADLYRRFTMTVVMVTHDIDRLPNCCNNVLLLKYGSVLAMGKPEDVFTETMLTGLYGCAIEVAVRNGRYHAFSLGAGGKR